MARLRLFDLVEFRPKLPDVGRFAMRMGRRYPGRLRGTMGLHPSRSYRTLLGRLRDSGGTVLHGQYRHLSGLVIRGAKGAYAKGHRFFGNQYIRVSGHTARISAGAMGRPAHRALAQAKKMKFGLAEARRVDLATRFLSRWKRMNQENVGMPLFQGGRWVMAGFASSRARRALGAVNRRADRLGFGLHDLQVAYASRLPSFSRRSVSTVAGLKRAIRISHRQTSSGLRLWVKHPHNTLSPDWLLTPKGMFRVRPPLYFGNRFGVGKRGRFTQTIVAARRGKGMFGGEGAWLGLGHGWKKFLHRKRMN